MSAPEKNMSVVGRRASRSPWSIIGASVVIILVAVGCGNEVDTAAEPAAPTSTSEEGPAAGPATEDGGSAQDGSPGDRGEGDATAADSSTGECEGAEALAGEQLEIGIPFGPGGYDQQGRIIGGALGERFGITPVVVNEPGAGGLVSLNKHITTDPEELRIQYAQIVGAAAAQLAEAEGALHLSLEEWPWLGQVQVDPQLVIAGADSGHESLEDVFSIEETPKFASYGPGSVEFLNANILGTVYDSEVDIVTGFPDTGDIIASLIRGDVDAFSLSVRSLLPSIEAGDTVPLALMTREPVEELPDVPLITEFVEEGSEEAELLKSHLDLLGVGRAFAAVPGADEDVVDTLECMLSEVLHDEEVVALIEQEEGNHVAYLSGEQVQEAVETVTSSSGRYVEMLKEYAAASTRR